MTVTPGSNGSRVAAEQDLERASSTPKISLMKDAINGVQAAARDYATRNRDAMDWWYARWPGQTCDGLRWATLSEEDTVWPWPGSSDSRIRLCDRLVREHNTVGKFALMNAKVQARANRPLAISEVGIKKDELGSGGAMAGSHQNQASASAQATTLLNWMIYTHMVSEVHREQDLMLSWRHGLGAAVTAVEWEQERRLEYVPVSLPTLADFVVHVGAQQQQQMGDRSGARSGVGAGGEVMGFITALAQTGTPMLELADMVMDPAYEDSLARLIQALSPVVTTRQAYAILGKLRDLQPAEIPVPYVFKSKPRWTTLRPMIDVLFPEETDDLQRARWIDRVEFVTERELVDRMETDGYDPAFVDDAIALKGRFSELGSKNAELGSQRLGFGSSYTVIGPGGKRPGDMDDLEAKIELHHFYHYALDRDVPVLFCTVMHMDLEDAAKHEPTYYSHGQMPFHGHRFETNERPILSSRGIPELAYTWERELKKQRDGRVDRTDLVLRPPLFTTYEALLKMKASYMPGAMIPMRKFDEIEKDRPPMWDPGSIEIDKTIMQTVDEFFWGGADTFIRKLRYQELGDAITTEYKPVLMQTFALMQQFLPDAQVARVIGPLSRPFHVEREDIQGQYEISITIDMRDVDADWVKQKALLISSILPMDRAGIIDTTAIVQNLFEAVDYTLADAAIKDPQSATLNEQQDENRAIDLIIGSGQDQPLPQGGNYQLRLQTLMTKVQGIQSGQNPATAFIVRQNPAIMKVLATRAQFFQRQLQQQQNAQIGRSQVSQTFTKAAPALVAPGTAQ